MCCLLQLLAKWSCALKQEIWTVLFSQLSGRDPQVTPTSSPHSDSTFYDPSKYETFWVLTQGEKSSLLQSLKCPLTNFSSSDKKAREAEGWGSESWPQAVLLVGGMLLSQHICISHWPYCLGVHLSQLKGCSHWGGSEFNPLQSSKQSNDRRTVKPQNQEWLVFSLFLAGLFIHSFLLSGIDSITWPMHFQKCFTYSGCHPCFGRKFILHPFLWKLQLNNPFGLQDCHSL